MTRTKKNTSSERGNNVDSRLYSIETMLERLEKRLWLIAIGVISVVLTQFFHSILDNLLI